MGHEPLYPIWIRPSQTRWRSPGLPARCDAMARIFRLPMPLRIFAHELPICDVCGSDVHRRCPRQII